MSGFYRRDPEGYTFVADIPYDLESGVVYYTYVGNGDDGGWMPYVRPAVVDDPYGFPTDSLEHMVTIPMEYGALHLADIGLLTGFLRTADVPPGFDWYPWIMKAKQTQWATFGPWSTFDDPGQVAWKILSGMPFDWAKRLQLSLLTNEVFRTSQADGARAWRESQAEDWFLERGALTIFSLGMALNAASEYIAKYLAEQAASQLPTVAVNAGTAATDVASYTVTDMTGFYTPDVLTLPPGVVESVVNPASLPFNPATDFLINTAPTASEWTTLTSVNTFGVDTNPLPDLPDYYSDGVHEPLQGGAEGQLPSDGPSPSTTNTPPVTVPGAGATASLLSTVAGVAKVGAGLVAALMSGTATQQRTAQQTLQNTRTQTQGTDKTLSPGLEIGGKVIPWPLVIAGVGLIYTITKG